MTIIIAIDGVAAAGKGTLSKMLAKKLKFEYLDTGKLYRILAYHALNNHLATDQTEKIIELIPKINFDTDQNLPIDCEEIGAATSKIAQHPTVRAAMTEMQRQFPVGKKGVVIDGRDIGTLIFPNATCKFFITANLEVRAQRRYKQLQNAGNNIIFDQVLRDLKERDERDMNRAVAPTVAASDAMIIDTSDLSQEQVLELVLNQTIKTLKQLNININHF